MNADMTTREKILYYGKQEFLHKGFKDASLRNISAAAGMTTGAVYTHFKDKNALFEAIVAPVCEQVENMFNEISSSSYNADGNLNKFTRQSSIT